ncbi:hypothetical protein GH714_011796 [Hevea brasiliensis]|uniref:Non-structural maintenance of chromosomes element 4 n=1 Tax=Hevea brasiliensis TaxID=3981 RepID=A0A6A6KCQ6_HEVBR|nr:hypothetical protein GH714_011796 [Hevea brasiliensis]
MQRVLSNDGLDDTGAEEKTDTDNNMSIMFDILRRNKRVRLENLILNRFDFKDWELMMDVVSDGDELMPDGKSSVTSELEPATNTSQETLNRTPMRKLSRNRGLVVQEDSVVEESPEIEDAKAIGSPLGVSVSSLEAGMYIRYQQFALYDVICR